ncbi:hypothetical protein [Parasphingorhabdus sp.]|uniref:hypothetical protein n=1 Tax=Parasphingorhabdus sp. TaxID=2709688 RepID=UPI003A93507B
MNRLTRRMMALERRLGVVPYADWSDSQLVERMNDIAQIFRNAGFAMPSLDPDCPDPEILDSFISEAKTACV